MRTLITLLATCATIAALGGSTVTAAPQEDVDRAAALSAFGDRIGEYAALHRRLEGPWLLTPSANPQSFLQNRAHLAAAIKTARPDARQGDIFTPAVARVFRSLIADALAGRDADAMVRDLYEEHQIVRSFHLRVYDPHPAWATHEMPAVLLLRLPLLPEDIEYRLVNHDLVLWDIHADLIVDVLPGALPRQTT
jgi:hypothetical protein